MPCKAIQGKLKDAKGPLPVQWCLYRFRCSEKFKDDIQKCIYEEYGKLGSNEQKKLYN